jgi:phytoene synthase
MVALAREHFTVFERRASVLPDSLRPAYLPASLSGFYLKRLSAAGAGAFKSTPDLPAITRQWILFRRASRGWPATKS